MGTTSVWINVDEEAFMRRQMAIAGETKLGAHIKRVYFGNLNPGEGVLAEVRHNGEMALDMLAALAKKPRAEQEENEPEDDSRDTELRLLAAIFMMLHASIGKAQQALIDRYIDPKVVEDFLKARGE
jgi:hypothetical protein